MIRRLFISVTTAQFRELLHKGIFALRRRIWPSIYGLPQVSRASTSLGHSSRILVHLHLHYPELWTEVSTHLSFLPKTSRIEISVTDNVGHSTRNQIQKEFPSAHIFEVPNVGRDVFPFLKLLQSITLSHFDAILKIHAKKSPQLSYGSRWRRQLLQGLLPSVDGVELLSMAVATARNISLAVPYSSVRSEQWWGANKSQALDIAALAGIPTLPKKFAFAGGSMFWAHPSALKWCQSLDLSLIDFASSSEHRDGSAAHAFERLFGAVPQLAGLHVISTQVLQDSRNAIFGHNF